MSDRRRCELVAMIVVLLNVGDVLITRRILRTHPASHEGNGLMAQVIMSRWVWVPKVGLPMFLLVGVGRRAAVSWRYAGLASVACLYAGVLGWNAHILAVAAVR